MDICTARPVNNVQKFMNHLNNIETNICYTMKVDFSKACLHVSPYLLSPVSTFPADGTFIPEGVGVGMLLLLVMSIVVVLIVVVVVIKRKTNIRKIYTKTML